jgi:CMP-N,N'-diacetyllegionaminic acid synthase
MTRRIIGLIPARGGSKRLPGKNLRTVGGVSLIGRALESAKQAVRSKALDGIAVSSDSEPIIAAAVAGNMSTYKAACDEDPVIIRRPETLANDAASMVDVALHACDELQLDTHDLLVLLQPTSPFRTAATIKRAIEALDGNPVVSVSQVTLPEHAYSMRDGLLNEASVVTPNGCVYVVGVGYLRLYRSFTFMARGLVVEGDEALDVDTRDDWIRARVIAGEKIASDPYGNYLLPEDEPARNILVSRRGTVVLA